MKVYRNKYHEAKDQYEVLREVWSERSTVTLFRSKLALRSWVVTKTFSNGDIVVATFDNERDAWQSYYGYAIGALESDARIWEEGSMEAAAV